MHVNCLIARLQKQSCKFLKVDLQRRLGLNEYELACQCLLPPRRGDDPNFDDKLDDNLRVVIQANISFIGKDSLTQNIELGLRKLVRLFQRREFSKFTALEVLDAYEVIWTERRFWKELGPNTMALIECILADPHSSANSERGGRVLKQTLTAFRKTMYELTIDAEMRIAMNGPH